jgi:mRNA degradation ribonuclease J1/J2
VSGQDLGVEALGVAGAPAPQRLTTAFRLGGGVLVDAGAAAHGIPVGEREQVEHLLLSHAHLDHSLGVPFLLIDAQPRICGLGSTLGAVRNNLLDGHIWPDLSDRAIWHQVEIGETFAAGPWEVEVGPANHTVPCVTYLLRAGDYSVAIVGDTRYDETVADWVAERLPTDCVVEASYPDRVAAMSHRHGHQTPADLARWRRHLGAECRMLVTHVKPAHADEVCAECDALGDPALHILQDGTRIRA